MMEWAEGSGNHRKSAWHSSLEEKNECPSHTFNNHCGAALGKLISLMRRISQQKGKFCSYESQTYTWKSNILTQTWVMNFIH